MKKSLIVVMVVVVVLALLSPYILQNNNQVIKNGEGGESQVNLKYYVWIVPWNKESYNAVSAKPELLYEVQPFWFTVNENGEIIGNVDEALNITTQNNIRLSPLVYLFDANKLHEFLTNETKINNFIDSYKKLVEKYGFSGINIDFEGILTSDSEKFVDFLSKLKDKFPSIEISVDVPFKYEGLESDWSAPYNYTAIGEVVDKVIIMCYDYHYSNSEPGPIMPTSALQSTIEYALERIPLEKIIIALPLYGYDWIVNGTGEAITTIQGLQIAEEHSAQLKVDSESFEYYFNYTDNYGREHIVYIQSRQSIENRVNIVKQYGITQIAYWYWGAAPLDWF